MVEEYTMSPRVSVEKAKNGFTVRCSSSKGEVTMVAKDIEEVTKQVAEMLEAKHKESKEEKPDKKAEITKKYVG